MKGKGIQRFILKAARDVSTTTASDFSVEQVLQVISGSPEHCWQPKIINVMLESFKGKYYSKIKTDAVSRTLKSM